MEVQVNQIVKRYSKITAVDDLSFKVNSGEIFAVLGPNGAGKSSMIRMLIGLTEPDKGEINFISKQSVVHRLDEGDYGYLPEERGLYQDRKVLNTLLFIGELKGLGKSVAQQQAEYWLEKFDLIDRQHDQLKTLSKGNQQKVQLISTILHRPAIVFLDEPFSGLDPVNQENVMGFLQDLKQQGMTIVLSAHQMSLVEKLADRFLLMNQGKAMLYGTMVDIRQAAQLGDKLSIQFAQSVDLAEFDDFTGIQSKDLLDALSIQFVLQQGCDLPKLLQQIMQKFKVNSLQTERPGLHDIYLSTVLDKSMEYANE